MALRRLSRLSPTVVLLIALAEMLAGAAAASERLRVRWYASHHAVPGNLSLLLGNNSHSFLLKGGWSCTVGPAGKEVPGNEFRLTTCTWGRQSFEFTVACDQSRREDHTQIRFRDTGGGFVDYIQVACEYTE
ncbi:MAG: hypothetical protein L0191_11065 [Acidobacteria bacterium]|nr:hypothetical protein [Acidobacteriota bacterium]